MLVFLKMNTALWTVLDVEKAVISWNGEDLIVLEDEESDYYE
jgi:hypothetical protein